MNSKLPLWYSLIIELKKERLTIGPTIPYLIGAYKTVNKPFAISREGMEAFLETVINSQVDKVPILQKCPELREYVIGLEKKEIAERYYTKEIYLKSQSGGNGLYLTQNASSLGKTPNEIAINLNGLYQTYIMTQKFSFDQLERSWVNFNPSQQDFIKQVYLHC